MSQQQCPRHSKITVDRYERKATSRKYFLVVSTIELPAIPKRQEMSRQGDIRSSDDEQTWNDRYHILVHICDAYKRSIRRFSLFANRSRDRRVSSKQFMLLGAHHVQRALSGRARSALIRRRMVSHRMAREYKGKGRDVSACRSASLSCRRQTRPLWFVYTMGWVSSPWWAERNTFAR